MKSLLTLALIMSFSTAAFSSSIFSSKCEGYGAPMTLELKPLNSGLEAVLVKGKNTTEFVGAEVLVGQQPMIQLINKKDSKHWLYVESAKEVGKEIQFLEIPDITGSDPDAYECVVTKIQKY